MSKISLKKEGSIQFEGQENRNIFRKKYSDLAGDFQGKQPKAHKIFSSPTTKNCYAKTSFNVANNFKLSNVSEGSLLALI